MNTNQNSNKQKLTAEPSGSADSTAEQKRSYTSPALVEMGDLRALVLGASGANPESGGQRFNL